MADETQTDPVFFDTLFHRKRKHGKWDTVDAPQLEGLVADTHAHLQRRLPWRAVPRTASVSSAP